VIVLHSITVVCPRLLTVGDSVVLFAFLFFLILYGARVMCVGNSVVLLLCYLIIMYADDFYGSFFTLIFAVLLVGANFYETRVLDSSYLRHIIQLPTSDSTEIIAGGIKVRLEGPLPLDAL